MPRILIAGAGVAGSYLWRLLVRKGTDPGDIQIVDPGSRTRCGIAPCAFGITRQFFPLCREVGLDPDKYILATPPAAYANQMKFDIKGYMFSIDKPAFIRDLLEGATVASEPGEMAADRIIDATGTARAYIGRYEKDMLFPCIQRKVEFSQPPELREYSHYVGYSWIIPLEGNYAHVGIGSATYSAETMKKVIEELAQGGKTICSCRGYIRGTGIILPLVRGNVWAVGEAGGIVEPLSGAGIVPAIESAKLLVEQWDDPRGYEAAITNKYGWFGKTSELVQEWQDEGSLNVRKLMRLWKQCAELAGLEPGIFNLARTNLLRKNIARVALQFASVREFYKSTKRPVT
jgi:flavin-dependent dehydrogenase